MECPNSPAILHFYSIQGADKRKSQKSVLERKEKWKWWWNEWLWYILCSLPSPFFPVPACRLCEGNSICFRNSQACLWGIGPQRGAVGSCSRALVGQLRTWHQNRGLLEGHLGIQRKYIFIWVWIYMCVKGVKNALWRCVCVGGGGGGWECVSVYVCMYVFVYVQGDRRLFAMRRK